MNLPDGYTSGPSTPPTPAVVRRDRRPGASRTSARSTSRRPTSSRSGSGPTLTSPPARSGSSRPAAARRLRRGERSPSVGTRRSSPTTAAAASAPGSPAGCRAGARAGLASSRCRSRRDRPATGCSRRSATTSAGTAGCWSCPRARDRGPAAARGLRGAGGATRRERGVLDGHRGRVPGVGGARAAELRGVRGES